MSTFDGIVPATDQADAAVTVLNRCNQGWQERRIVLAVAVERGDDRAARSAHAAAHRR